MMDNRDFIELLLAKYPDGPSAVRKFIRLLRPLIDCFQHNNVLSVILHGSTVRGEFTCITHEKRLLPLSDVEFLIILRKRDACLETRISKNLRSFETALHIEHNPFFHLDFSFISLSKYRRNPRNLRSFELQHSGLTIYGENVVHEAPTVSLINMDLGDLNEIAIVRLWNMLLYLPTSFLHGSLSCRQRLFFSYALYRNSLEIPTILLPHLGVLLCGFKERINNLRLIPRSHAVFEYFPRDFPRFMTEVCQAKLDPKPCFDISTLYQKTLTSYVNLLRFLSADKSDMLPSKICGEISSRQLILRNQKHIKRNVLEMAYVLSALPRNGVRWSLNLLLLDRPKAVLCFLIHMHLAAIRSMSCPEEAAFQLECAAAHLRALRGRSVGIQQPYSFYTDDWKALRLGFAEFASQFFRFYRGKSRLFKEIIDEVQ